MGKQSLNTTEKSIQGPWADDGPYAVQLGGSTVTQAQHTEGIYCLDIFRLQCWQKIQYQG